MGLRHLLRICFKRKKGVVRHFFRTTGGLNDSPVLAIFFIEYRNWEVGVY